MMFDLQESAAVVEQMCAILATTQGRPPEDGTVHRHTVGHQCLWENSERSRCARVWCVIPK